MHAQDRFRDSLSYACFRPSQLESYYLGNLGAGVNGEIGSGTSCGPTNFAVANAQVAGAEKTFAYWTLEGPGATPSRWSPCQWGFAQGGVAAACMVAALNTYGTVSGLTSFGDVEGRSFGWFPGISSWYGYNVQVIQGFLDEVSSTQGVSPGLYEGLNYYTSLTRGFAWSSLKDPLLPFVWWAAGTDNCGNLKAPSTLQPASYYQSEFQKWQSLNAQGKCTNGGYGVSLWQYFIPSSGTYADFDITVQDLNRQITTEAVDPAYFGPARYVRGAYWLTGAGSGAP